MPSRGETGRIPQINGFGSCWERPPKPPSGPASHELRSLPASQGHHHGGSSIWYSRPQPDIARAQPHLGAKICSLKWAQELEAPKLTRQLVERRVRFISKACNRVGSFRPKADSTPTSQRAELLRMGEGAHAETSQSALMVILKLAISALISVILIVLSAAFSSRGSLFPFLRSQFSELWQLVVATGFPGGSDSQAPVCNAGDPDSIPGLGRYPEKEIAAHSSTLAWKIPWTEEPGRLQSMGSQAGHHVVNFSHLQGFGYP